MRKFAKDMFFVACCIAAGICLAVGIILFAIILINISQQSL